MAVLRGRANKPRWARVVKLRGDWGGSNEKPEISNDVGWDM